MLSTEDTRSIYLFLFNKLPTRNRFEPPRAAAPGRFCARGCDLWVERRRCPIYYVLRERMRFDAEQEVLESVFVEMDPILHGFHGVLVELVGAGRGTCSWRPPPARVIAS